MGRSKKSYVSNLGARAAAIVLPMAPTAAVECAVDEEHAHADTAGEDEEGGSSSSSSEGPDSEFDEEGGPPIDPLQTTLTMHWPLTAFQETQEPQPRPHRGEFFSMGVGRVMYDMFSADLSPAPRTSRRGGGLL